MADRTVGRPPPRAVGRRSRTNPFQHRRPTLGVGLVGDHHDVGHRSHRPGRSPEDTVYRLGHSLRRRSQRLHVGGPGHEQLAQWGEERHPVFAGIGKQLLGRPSHAAQHVVHKTALEPTQTEAEAMLRAANDAVNAATPVDGTL